MGNLSVELRPGWNPVAFQGPMVTSLAVNGTIPGFASWDGTSYRTANFNQGEVNSGAAGRRGLWVFSEAASSFTYQVSGDTLGRTLSLREGWNLAAFADSGPVGNLTARADGQTVPLDTVVLKQFTRLNADNTYSIFDATTGTLDSTRPYWIYSARAVTLAWTSAEPPAASPTPTPSPLSSPYFPGGGGGPAPTPVPTPLGTLRFEAASFPVTTSSTRLLADQLVACKVEVVGPSGQVVPSAAPPVTLTLETRPLGGSLTGPTTQQAAAGLASFSGLGLDKVGCYRLRASAPNCLDGLSPDLWIRAGVANRLGFVSSPAVGTVGRPLAPLTVELQDVKGNTVLPGATNYHVTLGLAPGGAVLQGTPEGDLQADGRLTIPDARVSAAGTFQLTAEAGGVLNATMTTDLIIQTEAATVGPAETTAAQIAFGPPAAPGTAGVSFPETVRVLNGNGDVLTSATGFIQLYVENGTPAVGANNQNPVQVGPGVTVLKAPVKDGVATFDGIGQAAIIGGPAPPDPNGRAVIITRAGNWTLRAVWSQGLPGATSPATIAAAATASVNFQDQDGSAQVFQPGPLAIANATLQGQSGANPYSTPIIGALLDAFGNRNLTDTRDVKLEFTSAGHALQGTITKKANALGLVVFDAVAFPQGRLGLHTLSAVLGNLTSLTAPFELVAEPVSSLSNGELSPVFPNANGPHITSGDGRYVVYTRQILNGFGAQQGSHVWRKDRQTGQELQIDVGSADNVFSEVPGISPNGEYVVFRSNHPFGGATLPNGARQIWRWHNGTITLASHVTGDVTTGANNHCQSGDVNDSGLVVFDTQGDNVAPNKRGSYQVYATTVAGAGVQVVSESSPGVMMDNSGFANPPAPTVSADGKVSFTAFAFDMPGYNAAFAVACYRRDLSKAVDAGGLVLVTAKPNDPGLSFAGFCQFPVISANGRYVTYFAQSFDGSLPTDNGGRLQVYRRDCDGPATALVFVSEGQTQQSQAGNGSCYASISADGRYVSFVSSEGLRGTPAAQLGAQHVYRRDCDSNTLVPLNRHPNGSLFVVPNFGVWASIAANNPPLTAFFTLDDSLYRGIAGEVYMVYRP